MKEIVIISGKGGTGKTSLTASFIQLAKNNVVAADCDVDAADMHLLLHPDFRNEQDYYSGYKAQISNESCTNCGVCAQKCKFGAIAYKNGEYVVDNISCEGCGFCARICPASAIAMKDDMVGKTYTSDIGDGCKMVHAVLNIGAGNSGKLVAKVRKMAREIAENQQRNLIIVDGPPGIGCPVVSSLTGASLVVLVTEPTVSGLHDLKRVYALVKKFNIPSACIINKYDLNFLKAREIEEFLENEGITHISNIVYRDSFSKAIIEGKTILEFGDEQLSEKIENSWEKINLLIETI